jgi:hypothetical protein
MQQQIIDQQEAAFLIVLASVQINNNNHGGKTIQVLERGASDNFPTQAQPGIIIITRSVQEPSTFARIILQTITHRTSSYTTLRTILHTFGKAHREWCSHYYFFVWE